MSFNLTITDKPTHVVVWTDAKDNVSDLVKTLTERVASLEETVSKLLNKEFLSGIELQRKSSIGSLSAVQESDSNDLFKRLIETRSVYKIDANDADAEGTDDSEEEVEVDVEEVEVEQEDAEEEVEEEEEEEVEVEEEEEVEVEVEEEAEEEAEEAEEEAEEAEEEAEEALELEGFEYKGVNYFRDTENQVYQVDADGDLDDSPIGIWSEEKQKVLKYAKA